MAQRKSSRKSAATARKKTPTSRTSPARKAAGKSARKAAAKKTPQKAAAKKAPRKAAARTAAKKAPRKAAAKSTRKAAAKTPRKAAAKAAPARPALVKAAPARFQRTENSPSRARPPAVAPDAPRVRPVIIDVEVETTSAGIQPLAPEHAPVDDLTSTGNELLDIFQRYDRNRTGSIEQPEFARLLEALGQNINDEELAIAFDIIDTERTGKISWKQFKNWWTSR
jgi:hypothetical protein